MGFCNGTKSLTSVTALSVWFFILSFEQLFVSQHLSDNVIRNAEKPTYQLNVSEVQLNWISSWLVAVRTVLLILFQLQLQPYLLLIKKNR